MSISIKPLGNRVVVEPIEQEEVTSGGIVLPETAKEKPQNGTVLAAGMMTENGSLWMSKREILCCSRNIQAQRSSWMARKCSSCVKATY